MRKTAKSLSKNAAVKEVVARQDAGRSNAPTTKIKKRWRITPSELKRIKISADRARTNVIFDKLGLTRWSQEAEENLWSDDDKRHAKGVFAMLRMDKVTWGEITLINTPATRKAVLSALERNDRDFFVWFGRILSIDWASKLKIPKRTQFILNHWDRAADALPELFYLTKSGVTNVCSTVLGETFSDDAVSKECGRLGLLSSSGKKIKVIPGDQKLTFLTPDGKTFLWPVAPQES